MFRMNNYLLPGPDGLLLQYFVQVLTDATVFQIVIAYDGKGNPVMDGVPDYQDFRVKKSRNEYSNI